MAKKQPVTTDLLVLDIKPHAFSDEFRKFRDEHSLMYIKGCRRDVLIGQLSIGFSNASEDVAVYEGKEAYSHLLTYVTGLISRIRGESQIVSQFKNAYSELKERDPIQALKLQRLYNFIAHDNGLIRTNVTPDLKPAFYEACAHELSEQLGQEVVLVVLNMNKAGTKPDESTENIIRYLGNNRKNAAKRIIFTHPDPQSLDKAYSYFLKQKQKNRITCSIGKISFQDAFDATSALQGFEKVYVCLPMGVDIEADERMLREWRQREVLGGKLTHLGGATKPDRQSKGVWLNPELFNFVAPEDVVGWQKTRQYQNAEIIKKGKAACDFVADLRSRGQRPNSHNLRAKILV